MNFQKSFPSSGQERYKKLDFSYTVAPEKSYSLSYHWIKIGIWMITQKGEEYLTIEK